MKVTKQETFTPITIVLETKEEADYLWHRLNVNENRSFRQYCVEENIELDSNFCQKFFELIDKEYTPEGYE